VAKLTHELEVHQIELQMQNDELRETARRLKESQSQYEELYRSAPVGYITLDMHGTISKANNLAIQALGLPFERLRERAFSSFILPEDHGSYFESLRKIIVDRMKDRSFEIRLLRNGTEPFFVQMGVTPFYQDQVLEGWRIAFMGVASSNITNHPAAGSLNLCKDCYPHIPNIQGYAA
jgi:PAS domain S-box-containing protein